MVWSLVYIALAYLLVAVAGALAPGFVREVLGLGEKNVVVLVAPGLGVVVGLGALNVISGRLAPNRAIGTGLVVTAINSTMPRRGTAARSAVPGATSPISQGSRSSIGLVNLTALRLRESCAKFIARCRGITAHSRICRRDP